MHVAYGGFHHPDGEVELSITSEMEYSENNAQVVAILKTWAMSGVIIADGQAAITSALRARVNAYNTNGRDLRLLGTNNARTPLELLSANCIGGTKVVNRGFPDNRNGAYSTFLNYSVTVQGREAVTLSSGILTWSQTVRRAGGGPRFGHLEPLVGNPIKQTLKRRTVYRVIQSGSASGMFGYPTAPNPMWPTALVEAPETEVGTPIRRGFGGDTEYTEFPISWSYRFESATPLVGIPAAWSV